MDFAALGAVGAVGSMGIDIAILYWKIGDSASLGRLQSHIFINPWDIRTYGDSESDNPVDGTGRGSVPAVRARTPRLYALNHYAVMPPLQPLLECPSRHKFLNANEMIPHPYSGRIAVVD